MDGKDGQLPPTPAQEIYPYGSPICLSVYTFQTGESQHSRITWLIKRSYFRSDARLVLARISGELS